MLAAIETYNGEFFNLDPDDLSGVTIDNLAHALSGVNRFNSHTKQMYSVAEHSVHVASMLPPELQLVGLLHDGSEAFIQDIPSPFKQFMPDYSAIESVIQNKVWKAFGLSPEWVDSVYSQVKAIDTMMCQVEAVQLLPSKGEGWASTHGHPGIFCLAPETAEGLFLYAFVRISKGQYFTGALTLDYLKTIVGDINAICTIDQSN